MVFDPERPLTIESADELGDVVVCVVSSGQTRAVLGFLFEEARGIRVFNATPETAELLGPDLVWMSYRTVLGSIQKARRSGADPVFPVEVPCWWQGGNTPGWVD